MTLVLGIANESGAWMSTDFQISRMRMGKAVAEPDPIQKQVALQFRDGILLVGYTGLGLYRDSPSDKIGVAEWVQGILRGRDLNPLETLHAIRDYASATLGALCQRERLPLMFVLCGAFKEKPPIVGYIVNTRADTNGTTYASDKFGLAFQAAEAGKVLAAGSGKEFVRHQHMTDMRRIAVNHPKRHRDYACLLAKVNQGASRSPKSGGLVGTACIVSWVIPHSDKPHELFQEYFGCKSTDAKPPPPRLSLFEGIDVGLLAQGMLDASLAASADARDAIAEKALLAAIEPKFQVPGVVHEEKRVRHAGSGPWAYSNPDDAPPSSGCETPGDPERGD